MKAPLPGRGSFCAGGNRSPKDLPQGVMRHRNRALPLTGLTSLVINPI